jgi:hypothetical protein
MYDANDARGTWKKNIEKCGVFASKIYKYVYYLSYILTYVFKLNVPKGFLIIKI